MTSKLSVIILTFNEEQRLPDCLQSLSGLPCDLYLVDSGSSDRTLDIARSYGMQILHNKFENYSQQRNWAFDTIGPKTPWTLCLDADERLSPQLKEEIRRIVEQPAISASPNGYFVRKQTVFLNRIIRFGGQSNNWHLRLFKSGLARCENRLYDQHFVLEGQAERLRGALIDIITESISDFIIRHNRWAKLEAEEIFCRKSGQKMQIAANPLGNPLEQKRFLKNNLYMKAPLFVRAFFFWLYSYILRLGFLDGIQGLIFFTLQRFWFRFLVDVYLWQKMHEKK